MALHLPSVPDSDLAVEATHNVVNAIEAVRISVHTTVKVGQGSEACLIKGNTLGVGEGHIVSFRLI
jgi:hypothetical protein